MTFNRTSLPPVVRLGGSTDVGVLSTMTHTTKSDTPLVRQPVVIRIPQPPDRELQPIADESPVVEKRSGSKKRATE